MTDVIFVATIVGFFAVSIVLIYAFERLRSRS
jgi:hypothetical protein